jgi:hypothetical protein
VGSTQDRRADVMAVTEMLEKSTGEPPPKKDEMVALRDAAILEYCIPACVTVAFPVLPAT